MSPEQKHKDMTIDEEIKVNTDTKVQVESHSKRIKMEEAVRKILLFKDMK